MLGKLFFDQVWVEGREELGVWSLVRKEGLDLLLGLLLLDRSLGGLLLLLGLLSLLLLQDVDLLVPLLALHLHLLQRRNRSLHPRMCQDLDDGRSVD